MLNMTVASDDGEVVVVRCEGDINQLYFQIGNPLERLLGCLTFTRKTILNLERVNFLDSSGISWLATCHKHFLQQSGRMVLCTVPPRIKQVLQFCRMDRILAITEDEEAARILFRGQGATR
jgi:stage II sporulation protein AA (anti-sigma F factor antagonist)